MFASKFFPLFIFSGDWLTKPEVFIFVALCVSGEKKVRVVLHRNS